MSTFQQFVVALALGVLPLLYACRQEREVPPDELVTIRQGQITQLPTGVTLFADTVSIMPCPPFAYCTSPYLVFVALRLAKGTQSQPVRLFAPNANYTRRSDATADSTGVLLDGITYKLILRGAKYTTGSAANTRMDGAVVQVTRL